MGPCDMEGKTELEHAVDCATETIYAVWRVAKNDVTYPSRDPGTRILTELTCEHQAFALMVYVADFWHKSALFTDSPESETLRLQALIRESWRD